MRRRINSILSMLLSAVMLMSSPLTTSLAIGIDYDALDYSDMITNEQEIDLSPDERKYEFDCGDRHILIRTDKDATVTPDVPETDIIDPDVKPAVFRFNGVITEQTKFSAEITETSLTDGIDLTDESNPPYSAEAYMLTLNGKEIPFEIKENVLEFEADESGLFVFDVRPKSEIALDDEKTGNEIEIADTNINMDTEADQTANTDSNTISNTETDIQEDTDKNTEEDTPATNMNEPEEQGDMENHPESVDLPEEKSAQAEENADASDEEKAPETSELIDPEETADLVTTPEPEAISTPETAEETGETINSETDATGEENETDEASKTGEKDNEHEEKTEDEETSEETVEKTDDTKPEDTTEGITEDEEKESDPDKEVASAEEMTDQGTEDTDKEALTEEEKSEEPTEKTQEEADAEEEEDIEDPEAPTEEEKETIKAQIEEQKKEAEQPKDESEPIDGEATEEDLPLASMRKIRSARKSRASIEDYVFDAYWLEGGEATDNYIVKTNDCTLKYQVEIHFSRDVEAGRCKITVPKYILYDRYGTPYEPMLPVPNGTAGNPTPTSASPFNYYVSGDDLIFWNYKDIQAGTNSTFQVLYRNIISMDVADGTTWDLTPSARVEFDDGGGSYDVQEKVAPTLAGMMDTEVHLTTAKKSPYIPGSTSYNPELYTPTQVKSAIAEEYYGNIPANFEQYVYVKWKLELRGGGNQPKKVYVKDMTNIRDGADGIFIGANKYMAPCTEPEHAGYMQAYVWPGVTSPDTTFTEEYYFVTAYPASDVIFNQTVVENHIDVRLVPYDGVDEYQTKSSDAEWVYRDFVYNYTGEIIGVTKYNDDTKTYPYNDFKYSGWIDLYKNNKIKNRDTGGIHFFTNGRLYTYNVTHWFERDETGHKEIGEYLPGTYCELTTTDDVMYVYPQNGDQAGEFYMLGKEDYYYNSISFQIKETAYDIYEDVIINQVEDHGIDKDIYVYVMYEDSTDWELVDTIPFSTTGEYEYIFSPAKLARHPYRVKVTSNATEYHIKNDLYVGVTIRHDSPVFENMLNSNGKSFRIENVSGVKAWATSTADPSQGWWVQGTDGTYPQEGLVELTEQLHGVLLLRSMAWATLIESEKKAEAIKKTESKADNVNGRVNMTYTVKGYESYEVYNEEVVNNLIGAGVEPPIRKAVDIYDLLPYGVVFDPTKEVRAGLINTPNLAISDENEWTRRDVTVTIDPDTDVIDDWNNTGRTMLVFHLSYSGDDTTRTSGGYWYTGYGLRFGAYVKWEDLKTAQKDENLAAYMPAVGDDRPLFADQEDAYLDDGTQPSEYSIMGTDINGDGITNIRNIVYAKAISATDFPIATVSGIEKYVRADSDVFSEFIKETAVHYGEGYQYQVQLKNSSRYALKNIVMFDRIENAALDRRAAEPETEFEADGWHGTFRGLDLLDLTKNGIAPVVYYNSSRTATIPTTNIAASLTPANGWYEASAYPNDLSTVKAIAVDITNTAGGEPFKLQNEQSVSFKIKMTAPSDAQTYNYAYNNPTFYSITEGLDLSEDVEAYVEGNSIRTKLSATKNLEVEKKLDANVPDSLKGSAFTFTLKRNGVKQANRVYKLYKKNGTDYEEIESDILHATDASGQFSLEADQKAIFYGITDTDSVTVEEIASPYWEQTQVSQNTATQRIITITNKYRPVLFVRKKIDAGGTDLDFSARTFKIKVYQNNTPYANKEVWKVSEIPSSVLVIPDKLGTLTTDAEGCVLIRDGETIAIRMDSLTDTYRVEETTDSQGPGTDWICTAPVANGTFNIGSVSQKEFENIYRWKRLRFAKALENQRLEDCTETFKFRLWKMNDNYSSSNILTAENIAANGEYLKNYTWRYSDDETVHTVGNDGYLTAANAGKIIYIDGLESGKYAIQEIVENEDYKPIKEIEAVSISQYLSSGSVQITNVYQPCDLTVKKTILRNEPKPAPTAADLGDFVGSGISYTMNLDENGTQQGRYASNWDYDEIRGTNRETTDYYSHVITIPGADLLKVTIRYGLQFSGDYACMWEGDHGINSTQRYYASNSNHRDYAIANLTGPASGTRTYYVEGNSATFSFYVGYHSSSSYSDSAYGYYATVEGYTLNPSSIGAPFRIKIEKYNEDTDSWAPLSNTSGTTGSGSSTQTVTTDADGYIDISENQIIRFHEIGKIGERYRFSEIPDPDFPPIEPAQGSYYEVALKAGGTRADILNGSKSSLFIKKRYVGTDEYTNSVADGINNFEKPEYQGNKPYYVSIYENRVNAYINYPVSFYTIFAYLEINEGNGWEIVKQNENGYKLYFIDGANKVIELPYTTDTSNGYMMYSSGLLLIPSNTTIIVNNTQRDISNAEYRLTEVGVGGSYLRYYWSTSNLSASYYPTLDNVHHTAIFQNIDKHILKVEPITETIEGNINDKNNITLENKITDLGFEVKRVTKTVVSDITEETITVPAGSKLTLRIDKYDGSNWIPQADVPYSFDMIPNTLSTGGLYRTDATGTIELIAPKLSINLPDYVVPYANDVIGQYRVVEVPALTDEVLGEFYKTAGITDYVYGNVTQIVNKRAKSEIEIEKKTTEETDREFEFVITSKDRPGFDLSERPYEIYNSLTNELIKADKISENNTIKLKSNQYAKLHLPNGTYEVTELMAYPWQVEDISSNDEYSIKVQGETAKVILNSTYLDDEKAADNIPDTIANNVTRLFIGSRDEYANEISGIEGVACDKYDKETIKEYLVPNGSNYDLYIIAETEDKVQCGVSEAIVTKVAGKCPNLIYADVHGLNTHDTQMFPNFANNCPNLETLVGLNQLDYSNVKSMDGVVANCPKIKKIDFSGASFTLLTYNPCIKIKNNANLEEVNFSNCTIEMDPSVDYSGLYWNNSSDNFISNCPQLKKIDFSGARSETFKKFANLITGTADNLELIDFSDIYFPNCSFNRTFQRLKADKFDLSNSTISDLYYNGAEYMVLDELDLTNLTFTKNTEYVNEYMFQYSKIGSIVGANTINFADGMSLAYMFRGVETNYLDLSGLVFPDGSGYNTRYFFQDAHFGELNMEGAVLYDGTYMFSNCRVDGDVNLKNTVWHDKGGRINSVFYGLKADTVNMQNADFSEFESMEPFWNASEINVLDCTGVKIGRKGTYNYGLFQYCCAKKIILTDMEFVGDGDMSACRMFYDLQNTEEIVGLDTINFDRVTTLKEMFIYSKRLTLDELDFSGCDFSNVTDMSEMFSNISYINIGKINFSGLNLSNVTTMNNMFANPYDTHIGEIDFSGCDFSGMVNPGKLISGTYNAATNQSSINLLNLSNTRWDSVESFNNFISGNWIKAVDVTGITFNRDAKLAGMFSSPSLTTIYSNDDWSTMVTNPTSADTNVFSAMPAASVLVGAVPFNIADTTIYYANPTTGYFTRKAG